MDQVTEGEVFTFEREFSTDEVRTFGQLSGDQQDRHVVPNADGELMVQGLLTATIPTNIGAKLGMMGQKLTFEFHNPVYTGETIQCEWTNAEVTEETDRYALRATVHCANEADDVVMTATFHGIVWKDDKPA